MQSRFPPGACPLEDDAGNLARRLLGSFRKSGYEDFDRTLQLASQYQPAGQPASTLEEERCELLSAVAGDLSGKLAGLRSPAMESPAYPADAAAHLWLLRHLARGNASI